MIIEAAGGRFIDAGIIGGPPGSGSPPRFYASGPHEAVLGELDGKGIMGAVVGRRGWKGVGNEDVLRIPDEGRCRLADRSADRHTAVGAVERTGSGNVVKPGKRARADAICDRAARQGVSDGWGEMEEIAATFESVGVTGGFHHGAAEIFRIVAASPLGDERPETVDRNRTLRETVEVFAAGK